MSRGGVTYLPGPVRAGVAIVAGVSLSGYALVVVFDVMSRTVFSAPLRFLPDLADLTVPLILAAAFAAAALYGRFIVVDVISSRLRAPLLMALDVTALLLTAALMVGLAWLLTGHAFDTFEKGRATGIYGWPLWPVWSLAAAMLWLAALNDVVRALVLIVSASRRLGQEKP